MALKKLIFKPGINRDTTNYAQGSGNPDGQAGWFEGNKIRFLSGFPQKIGGWKLYNTGVAFAGVVRTMFNWTKDAYNLLAVGTNTNVFVESQGVYNNITPIRATFNTPVTNNCFSTVSDAVIAANPTYVKVTIVGANANAGDTVIFSGAVGFATSPTAATLNAAHIVIQGATFSPNSFYIDVGPYVTTGVVGGGVAIIAQFEDSVGNNVSLIGGGWGASSWGGSVEVPPLGWGIGAAIPIDLPIRIIYFDKFTNDLFFNYRYGGEGSALYGVPKSMYKWAFPAGAPPLTTRAIAIATLATAAASPYFTGADVPPEVTQILFDDNSNTLMAFGCNPYDVTPQPIDTLLIRYASQDNYLNWAPSDDAGISTAGYIRIQSGSNILRAVSNIKEILVFTESSITSVQYTYSFPNLFSQTLISANISLFAPRAVIAINNTLYWMGRDKFYIYNGRAEPLNCTLTLHVFDNLNFDQSDQCFAFHGEQFLEVWWFYCSGNSEVINSYVVYNYSENIWYYGDCDDGFVRTGWSESPLRPFPQGAEPEVVGGAYTGTSRLYNQESGVDSGVLPMTAFIQSADIDLPESGDRFVLVKRIIPDVSFEGSEGFPSVRFTVAPRNFPGSPYMTENQEGQPFPRRVNLENTTIVDQYTEQVFVRARARQMGVAISSDTLGAHWSLGAVRADVVPDGRRGISQRSGALLFAPCVNGADTCVGVIGVV